MLPPSIPIGLPSQLLQRRPDVLAADLSFLEAPTITGEVYGGQQNAAPLRAIETLNRAIRNLGGGQLDEPLALGVATSTLPSV